MTGEEKRKFNGFSRKTLKFLRKLKANNDKAWFEGHRADYEEFVLQPLRSLVVDLGDFVLDIDPRFEITPAVNKTISRIYRDTKFSKDKSPFRSTVWITSKNMYLVCNKKVDDMLFSSKLVDDLVFGFNMIAPFYHYLQKLILEIKTAEC